MDNVGLHVKLASAQVLMQKCAVPLNAQVASATGESTAFATHFALKVQRLE